MGPRIKSNGTIYIGMNENPQTIEELSDRIDNHFAAISQRLDKIEGDTHHIQNDTKTIPDIFKPVKEYASDIETLRAS